MPRGHRLDYLVIKIKIEESFIWQKGRGSVNTQRKPYRAPYLTDNNYYEFNDLTSGDHGLFILLLIIYPSWWFHSFMSPRFTEADYNLTKFIYWRTVIFFHLTITNTRSYPSNAVEKLQYWSSGWRRSGSTCMHVYCSISFRA